MHPGDLHFLLVRTEGVSNGKFVLSVFMLSVALGIVFVQFGKIGAILDKLVNKEKTYDDNEERWWRIHLTGHPGK